MRITAIPALTLLGMMLFLGFPSSFWYPTGSRDLLKAFICAGCIAAFGCLSYGAVPLVEDSEVKDHAKRTGPIINPWTSTLASYSVFSLITSAVLLIRYLYLLLPSAWRSSTSAEEDKAIFNTIVEGCFLTLLASGIVFLVVSSFSKSPHDRAGRISHVGCLVVGLSFMILLLSMFVAFLAGVKVLQ